MGSFVCFFVCACVESQIYCNFVQYGDWLNRAFYFRHHVYGCISGCIIIYSYGLNRIITCVTSIDSVYATADNATLIRTVVEFADEMSKRCLSMLMLRYFQ